MNSQCSLLLSSLDRCIPLTFFVLSLSTTVSPLSIQASVTSLSHSPSRPPSHSLLPLVHCPLQFLLVVQERSEPLLAIHFHHQILYLTWRRHHQDHCDTTSNSCLYLISSQTLFYTRGKWY